MRRRFSRGAEHVDVLTPVQRRRNMRAIRSSGTRPEQSVEAFLRAHRFRVDVQRSDLPGKPDLVLPARKLAIFVHGCFWHRHKRCSYAAVPASNTQFWERKFDENVARDKRKSRELAACGWKVVVVWECEARLRAFGRLLRIARGTPRRR